MRVATIEFSKLEDPSREARRIPIKIHFPEKSGRYPLILISHGGGGDWDSHLVQAQSLASSGYVVFCLQHTGSDKERLREIVRDVGLRHVRRAAHLLTINSKEALTRTRDLSFAIDCAIQWDREHGRLKGQIDTKSIAALGHSFGAYTVLAACGARPILDHLVPRVEPGSGLGPDLREGRIKAGIAYSPQGTGGVFFGKESYETIDRPLLMLSGSKDILNGFDGGDLPPERRKEAFDLMPTGGKLFYWLEGADHLSFYDSGVGSAMLDSDAREDVQRIANFLALAFCDFHLKGKTEAGRRLAFEATVNALCGKNVTKVTRYEK